MVEVVVILALVAKEVKCAGLSQSASHRFTILD